MSSEPMRVLWLVDSLAEGGRESLVIPFAQAINRQQIQLRVCSMEPTEHESGSAVLSLRAKSARDIGAFRRLVKLLRDEKIQLVHAHSINAIIWGVAAARMAKVPIVATLHAAPTTKGGVLYYDSLREWLMMELLRWPGSTAVAISDSVRRAFVQKYSLPQNRIRVVYNGIKVVSFERRNNERAIQLKSMFGLPQDARVVLSVAALRMDKGIDVLLRAFQVVRRSVPYAQLVIVGEGPMHENWSRLADHLGVGDVVHWAGYRNDVPALLAGSDLFVLPSRDDAFPMVLPEAMAAELPIVATQVGGIPEILDSPAVGVLVTPRDPVTLAREISRLLQDESARRSLGVAARRRVSEVFQSQAWVDRLMNTYRETAGERRGALKVAVVEFEGKGYPIYDAFQLSRAMAQEGAEVTLLTDTSYDLDALDTPFRVEKIFAGTLGRGDGATGGKKKSKEKKPRVSVPSFPGVFETIAHYRAWLKLLGHLRDMRYDVVQFGDVKFASDAFALRRVRKRTRFVAAVSHGVHRLSGKGQKLYGQVVGLFDRVLVYFEANVREFRSKFPVGPDRIRTVIHGNQGIFAELQGKLLTENRIRTELGFLPDEQVVLYFGPLSAEKGIDVLVEAFAWVGLRHERAQLVIVGPPGPDFSKEKSLGLGRNLGVGGRVRIVEGAVEAKAVAAWMRVAAVVVFPDREMYDAEELQIAQSFGTTIVATRVGVVPEILEDEVTALLVAPNDADGLAHAISRVLGDRELAQQLGAAARAASREIFDWRLVAREILASYS
jgi:glycosyltransferase involved in cell wall biosynthesis